MLLWASMASAGALWLCLSHNILTVLLLDAKALSSEDPALFEEVTSDTFGLPAVFDFGSL